MKRKSIALLLALVMCLALLSACGGNSTADTKEPSGSGNTSTPTGQEPAGGKEEQPTQQPEPEQPTQTPEQEASEEPTQEPTEEPTPELPEHEGTKLLALLQEEWKNGFVEGDGPNHTYYEFPLNTVPRVFRSKGIIYIWDWEKSKVMSYDIASKKLSVNENVFDSLIDSFHGAYRMPIFLRDDIVYCYGDNTFWTFDCDGTHRETFVPGSDAYLYVCLADSLLYQGSNYTWYLYSYDFEKIAEFSTPQYEAAHGVKEYVSLSGSRIVAGETVYLSAKEGQENVWYRINMDTYEWEKYEGTPWTGFELDPFCGKYGSNANGIYDITTGEQVFELAGLPRPGTAPGFGPYYFGGNKYLGSIKNADGRWEQRWLDLTDLSMSDPLILPAEYDYYGLYRLDETYCVYKDKYGWFLWNYNDGTEETIMMFNQ